MLLTAEQHNEMMQELIKGEVPESRLTEIVDSLSNDRSTFDKKIEETTKMNDSLMSSNTELRKSNAHWFNKVTEQNHNFEQVKEKEKEEERKTRSLSDALPRL